MKPNVGPLRPRALGSAATADYLGISQSSLWRYVKSVPGFPQPFSIAPGRSKKLGWLKTELDAYINARAAERKAA